VPLTVSRRWLIISSCVLAGTGFANLAEAAATKTIDRRVRSEQRLFQLTFAAERPSDDSKYGHAFIVWEHEDDARNMSVAEAIGFYPKGDPSNFELIFGTAGGLEDDWNTVADVKLIVQVNSDLFQRALDAKHAWEGDGTYEFLWSNCTTHAASIAHAIGLVSSNGNWEKPINFLNDLMNNNN
jgi:hypothetical protein